MSFDMRRRALGWKASAPIAVPSGKDLRAVYSSLRLGGGAKSEAGIGGKWKSGMSLALIPHSSAHASAWSSTSCCGDARNCVGVKPSGRIIVSSPGERVGCAGIQPRGLLAHL